MTTRRTRLADPAPEPLATASHAGEPLVILTADIRPLAIPGPATGEARRGIVPDVVAAAARRIGREPRFTFLPFPEAIARAAHDPGTLIAPFGRVAEREAGFAWVAKVVDVPQVLGTLADRPVADLAAARALARVGVIRGGVQETFLREQGLTNLVVLGTGPDLALALAEGRVDAWYSNAPEIALSFEAIGHPGGVRAGPALQRTPAWLAGHRDTRDLPVALLREAIAALEADGTVERIYRSYVAA